MQAQNHLIVANILEEKLEMGIVLLNFFGN